MKIGIIGGGSIGLLFAYYISRQHPVCLYVRTNEQKEVIRDKGLIVMRGYEEHKEEIEMKLVSEWRGLEDSVFIAVKQYQLPSVIEILQKYGRGDHFALLTKWNGSYKVARSFARKYLFGNCGAWGHEDEWKSGLPYGNWSNENCILQAIATGLS